MTEPITHTKGELEIMVTNDSGHTIPNKRTDRFYPLCPLSKLFCSLIRRNKNHKAECLVQWQIDMIKKAGIGVRIENTEG